MPIPADYHIKAGHYVLDAQPGTPFWGCNCSAQPALRTLRHIAANRHLFSPWPAKAPAQTTTVSSPAPGVTMKVTQ